MTILSYHNVKVPHTSAHSLLTMQTSMDLSGIADVYYYANRGGSFSDFKTIYGFEPVRHPSLHLRITRNSHKGLASVEKRSMALKDIISLRHDAPVVYVTQIKPLKYFLALKKIGFGIRIVVEPHSETERWDKDSFANVDGIIYTSKSLRGRLMSRYLISPDIPNRVFYHRVRTKLPVEISLRMPAAGEYRIGYIGGLEIWKGTDTIIEALRHLPEKVTAQFIGGEKDGSDHSRLLSRVKALGLEKRVIFTEHVPQETIPKITESIDAFVLPLLDSRQGSLPMKLFDYMLLGRPIIAASQESIREVLNDSSAVFFPAGADTLLAEQIRTLSDNPALGNDLAVNAYNSLKSFTVEKWLTDMEDFLTNLRK